MTLPFFVVFMAEVVTLEEPLFDDVFSGSKENRKIS